MCEGMSERTSGWYGKRTVKPNFYSGRTRKHTIYHVLFLSFPSLLSHFISPLFFYDCNVTKQPCTSLLFGDQRNTLITPYFRRKTTGRREGDRPFFEFVDHTKDATRVGNISWRATAYPQVVVKENEEKARLLQLTSHPCINLIADTRETPKSVICNGGLCDSTNRFYMAF